MMNYEVLRMSNNIQKTIELPKEEVGVELPSFPFVSLQELAKLDIKKNKLIVDPFIFEGSSMEINGGTGIGKTWFTLELVCSIATGQKFMDKYEVPNPRPVYYIDGEMPFDSIRTRTDLILNRYLWKINKPSEIPLFFSNPYIFKANIIPKINNKELTQPMIKDNIKRIADKFGSPIFFVADNLSCLTDYKENDNDDWVPMFDFYTELKTDGHSICHIHHQGKGGQQRGSSRKHDALDTVITLKRPEEYDASEGAVFNVKFDKHRHFAGEKARSFQCAISVDEEKQRVSWELSDFKDVSAELILKSYLENLPDITYEKLEKILGTSKSTIGRCMLEMKKNGIYLTHLKEVYGDEWHTVDKLYTKKERETLLENEKEGF